MNNIFVTGITGFVGSSLASYLLGLGYKVSASVREGKKKIDERISTFTIENFSSFNAWLSVLEKQDVVIHCAAQVHRMDENSTEPLLLYRDINTLGTLRLAREAANAGVKRFIFISSIKVNGEFTLPGSPFRASDLPAPVDPYAVSKYEAELGLLEIAKETKMEVVIIRPPLVYGPGVKGNFANMMKYVRKGYPLPLGRVNNKRSLVSIDNLLDLIVLCVYHPDAVNQIFLVSDGQDLSTPELLRQLALVMQRPSRLLPIPESLLLFSAALAGKQAIAQRLLASLQVDLSKTKNILGWTPSISVEEGLKRYFSEC